jgi:hypothetical protein
MQAGARKGKEEKALRDLLLKLLAEAAAAAVHHEEGGQKHELGGVPDWWTERDAGTVRLRNAKKKARAHKYDRAKDCGLTLLDSRAHAVSRSRRQESAVCDEKVALYYYFWLRYRKKQTGSGGGGGFGEERENPLSY